MSLNRLNRKQISDNVAHDYYEAAQRMKRETGKSVGDILIELLYGPETPHLARVQALRVFYEVMATFLDDDSTQELLELTEDESLKETH
jgi:predicted CopG family antitoxin